jgi:hypothetical protein
MRSPDPEVLLRARLIRGLLPSHLDGLDCFQESLLSLLEILGSARQQQDHDVLLARDCNPVLGGEDLSLAVHRAPRSPGLEDEPHRLLAADGLDLFLEDLPVQRPAGKQSTLSNG